MKTARQEKNAVPVLVTGATGFVGQHLARYLLRTGIRPRLLVRDARRLAEDLRMMCDVVTGDITDAATIPAAVVGVEQVFHCAANVHTWDRDDAYFRTNVLGVQNLLQALANNGCAVRIVHLSTVDVYGFPETPCDETCLPTGGDFGYGRSKWQGEQWLYEFCTRTGIVWTVLRPANIIGPGSQFISRIGDELRSGLMLLIDGGHCHAGFVYIDNLLDTMLWAMNSEAARGQCYNVRDWYDVSWKEFIYDFRRAIQGKGWVIDLPYGVADFAARVIANVWQRVMPDREPLLHPLLVRLFGRTCGHSVRKLRRDGGLCDAVGYAEALHRSVRWYNETIRPR